MNQTPAVRSNRRILAWVAGSMMAAALAAPAAADWLVTRDGARVETRGPWEVKGRQVVFTLKDGTLSALRLADVNLEASAEATAESRAQRPAEEADAEVERKPVLVHTNKEVRRAAASDVGSGGKAEAEGETEGEDAAQAPAGPLSEVPVEVVSWKANPSRLVDGLELAGAVRNNGTSLVGGMTVKVKIPDGDGGTLYETDAFLRSSALAPGGTTTFRALLPGIFQLPADPVFQIDAEILPLGAAPAEPPAEGEGEGQAGGG